MAIDFPVSPTIGQVYTDPISGRLWVWDGDKWNANAGTKGDKGTKGDQGTKGDTGDKGDKGEAGVKGDTGDKGDQGDKGDTGIGVKGDKGNDGTAGTKGDIGDKGDKGEPGAGSTIAITDDTTTNATRYILFEDLTTGNLTSVNVSSTKLTYNPSTGTLTTTTVSTTSDITRKTNVQDIENPLDIISKLHGVRFDWRHTNTPSLGVIAQDVEEILPELVLTSDDLKSVNYNGIIAILIEAVKDQQAQIEDLKANFSKI
jgi:hypothetical protein